MARWTKSFPQQKYEDKSNSVFSRMDNDYIWFGLYESEKAVKTSLIPSVLKLFLFVTKRAGSRDSLASYEK